GTRDRGVPDAGGPDGGVRRGVRRRGEHPQRGGGQQGREPPPGRRGPRLVYPDRGLGLRRGPHGSHSEAPFRELRGCFRTIPRRPARGAPRGSRGV
ncbi:MAG: hypothetical protein AVDCRST_MAG22-2286, partial [uncultured Rubrobacteraceae bacterium]